MICAFDIPGEDCLAARDDNRKYCPQCPFRCDTLEDMAERKKIMTDSEQYFNRMVKRLTRCEDNLKRLLKEKAHEKMQVL